MAKDPKTPTAPVSSDQDAQDALQKVVSALRAGEPGEKVKVRGPEDGRWRGGIQFGPTEVEIDLGEISAKAWAEIEADSYLDVRWPELAPAPEPEKASESKKEPEEVPEPKKASEPAPEPAKAP